MIAAIARFLDAEFARSFDKQLHLGDLIGECDWNVDLKQGLLSFQDRYSWRIQILGTESTRGNTWLWAWANVASNLPPNLIEASLQLREFGKEHGIPEFTEAKLSLDQIDGHTIALIASGICCHHHRNNGSFEA